MVNMFQYRFSTNSTSNLSLAKFASSGPINGNATNYEVIYLDVESNSTVFPRKCRAWTAESLVLLGKL